MASRKPRAHDPESLRAYNIAACRAYRERQKLIKAGRAPAPKRQHRVDRGTDQELSLDRTPIKRCEECGGQPWRRPAEGCTKCGQPYGEEREPSPESTLRSSAGMVESC